MNFEVFKTEAEAQARYNELSNGIATQIITDYKGGVWTIKWR